MIPVCAPVLGTCERRYVNDCLRTNWISSSGRYISALEEAFSRYCGKKYGITTTNGTAALHLALAALKIGHGDEVILPTFTIASTAFAVIYCGAKPIFVDSEPDTWNINVQKIEEKISKRTKVIMPVHIYGHPCDMSGILRIAQKYHLSIVEDAAEAHGAEYQGKKAGGMGDLGCFSFYSNKLITCGEGGMVVTDSKKLAGRCRYLKNLTFLEPKRFWHKEIGYNFRMTNLQAALGLAQFEQIERFIKNRRENALYYKRLLADIPGLILPLERKDSKNVYWMFGILIARGFGTTREKLRQRLLEKGIETRNFFIPMHQQPVIKKMGLVSPKDSYPVAEDIGRRGMYLPSGSNLKKDEIEYICDTIKRIQRGRS